MEQGVTMTCIHHWLLERPLDCGLIRATCKRCGEQRDYDHKGKLISYIIPTMPDRKHSPHGSDRMGYAR